MNSLTAMAEGFLGRELDPHEKEIVKRLEASGLDLDSAWPILESVLGPVAQVPDEELNVARYEPGPGNEPVEL